MALVTVQRSPSPSASAETDEQDVLDTNDSNLKSPRQRRRRSRAALKKLRKLFNTVRFVTKLKPCFSESYFTVKGAALILPQNEDTVYARSVTKSHGGDDIQSHLQAMFSTLRPQDTIKVAVKLEGEHTRYLAVVSCIGRQDTEESVILGMDLLDKAHIGLVLPVWAHTHIKLDGDGGFTIQSDASNIHTFKPVSVQAMWSALQSLNKVVKIAKDQLYIPRGLSHTWVSFYEAKLTTESYLVSEWNASIDRDLSYRPDKTLLAENAARVLKRTISSPVTRSPNSYYGEEDIYKRIKLELKNVMMAVDLEEVTCYVLRKSIEEKLNMDLKKYKSFIDTQMMEILGQMDAPSKILDYLYLGSEWNASNLEELQINGVQHILNISREIDNFFPGILHYMNIREWDVEASDLMKYWEDTHKFINKARKRGSKALVHCKMGISRSASTVIAYLMKENKWSLDEAFDFTKARRSIINPNAGFMQQLETYEGILKASWQRDIFESQKGSAGKPMSQISETDDIPSVECFQVPEDLMAVKLGDPLDGSDLPYLHTEHDIDIASRSADSTEDSLGDSQLSPETTKSARQSKEAYLRGKQKTESADFPDSDSDSSDFTESDDLSMSDEDVEKSDKGFVPIDIPDVLVQDVDMRKKPSKVDARRCKSESDKSSLNVDDKMASFSREGSVSKGFREDGSWIKPADDDEDENADGAELDEDLDKTPAQGDMEGIDQAEIATADMEEEGLWMTAKAVNRNSGTEKDLELAQLDTDNAAINVESEKTAMEISGDPYSKENIPWSSGAVLKQKQDIEERFGSLSGVFGACKKTDTLETSDSDPQKTRQDDSQENVKGPIQQPVITVTEEKIENQSASYDITDQSEGSKDGTGQSESTEAEEGENGKEMRKSVYEEEDIDLPEGIVRKTKMEIEERNRLSLESPRTKLKRSSSLKSNRVTPKSKDRNNERRRTCIVLLSPTHPDNTELDQSSFLDTSAPDQGSLSASVAQCHGGAFSSTSKASDDSEDESLKSGSVKVYKFMGEELTVEEGMVRKQTQDIESKAVEVLPRQQRKSESSPVSHEHCSNKPDSVSDIKHPSIDYSDESSTDDSKRIGKYSPTNVGKIHTSDSQESRQQYVNSNVLPWKHGDSSSASSTCSNYTTPKKQTNQRPESRFDSETLALIREIGSALLNSPAKAEMEEDDDVDLKEGDSLVSHYVRKIEKNVNVQTRKPQTRQILIIDKDAGNHGDKSRTFSPIAPISPKSDTDTKTTSSKWSPVAKKQTYSPSPSSGERSRQQSIEDKSASPKWSPISRTPSAISPKTVLNSPVSDNIMSELNLSKKSPVSMETKMEDTADEQEVCSVKSLRGKFELPEMGSGKVMPIQSAVVNTPSGTKPDQISSELQTSPCNIKGQGQSEVKGQIFSRSPIRQRHSEPVIHLNPDSLKLFEGKLQESGSSIYTKTYPVREESSDNLFRVGKGEGRSVQGQDTGTRPKSASNARTRGYSEQGQTSRSLGAKSGRGFLRQSHSVMETDTQRDQQFTWDGKKVRKSYGKSHPLAKLENRRYSESVRNNPFYNTM